MCGTLRLFDGGVREFAPPATPTPAHNSHSGAESRTVQRGPGLQGELSTSHHGHGNRRSDVVDSPTMTSEQAARRRCVCPGSFDPITNGHLDVMARSLELFDETVVAVLVNPAKQGRFSPAERVELIEASVAAAGLDASRITVTAFEGRLLVDVCREVGAKAIVKGLRGGTDFAYELPMALMNRTLTGVETVFLPGDPSLEHVSSSLVKEVAGHGADVSSMVPAPVWERLKPPSDV